MVIMIENERNFLNNKILKLEIKIPGIYTNCKLNKTYLTNGDKIFNPIIVRCSNCKKKFI